MSVFFDASVIVALFTDDHFSDRAEEFLRASKPTVIIGDFAAAEFSSVVARRVRTKEITPRQARDVFANFDAWTTRAAQRVETLATDVTVADAWIRRLDLKLRAPDAINIAIALRVNAQLATFDDHMLISARKLGLKIAKV